MRTSEEIAQRIERAAQQFTRTNQEKYGWSLALPGLKRRIIRLLTTLQAAMYPGIYREKPLEPEELGRTVRRYLHSAARQLEAILRDAAPELDAAKITSLYFEALPDIMGCLSTDLRAAYEGDPAARSEEEIMLSYPGFEAVCIYRLAHRLYELNVPMIPRIMTEYAHSRTGIDIHPGATIGCYFFIDHGTGVVIGETCRIGRHVKLYQGVTLGAKSFELDENGNPVKGIKRHPDIGDNVVIYSGATILGGSTVIGDRCVVGGNVWLTHSLQPGEKTYYKDEAC